LGGLLQEESLNLVVSGDGGLDLTVLDVHNVSKLITLAFNGAEGVLELADVTVGLAELLGNDEKLRARLLLSAARLAEFFLETVDLVDLLVLIELILSETLSRDKGLLSESVKVGLNLLESGTDLSALLGDSLKVTLVSVGIFSSTITVVLHGLE